MKQAAEFGIQQSGQTMVAFLLFVNDVHGMVPQHRQPTKSVSLEFAGCMLAAAKQRLEFGALDLASSTR